MSHEILIFLACVWGSRVGHVETWAFDRNLKLPNEDMSYTVSRFLWEFSSTLIDYHYLGPNERELLTTPKKNLIRFKFNESARESMRANESTWEFQGKREWEFKLSTTLLLVCPKRLSVIFTANQILTCVFFSREHLGSFITKGHLTYEQFEEQLKQVSSLDY